VRYLKPGSFDENHKELANFVEEVAEKHGCTFQKACRIVKEAYRFEYKFRLLTRRERDIAILAAWGASVNETAEKLFLAPSTVQSYRYSIRRKLDIPTRLHLKAHLAKDFYEYDE
jgi:DNA-binding CsgD family transcriptional regulator